MPWGFYHTLKGGSESAQRVHKSIEEGSSSVNEPERSIRHHILRAVEEAVASLPEDSLVKIRTSGSQSVDVNGNVLYHSIMVDVETHRHQ